MTCLSPKSEQRTTWSNSSPNRRSITNYIILPTRLPQTGFWKLLWAVAVVAGTNSPLLINRQPSDNTPLDFSFLAKYDCLQIPLLKIWLARCCPQISVHVSACGLCRTYHYSCRGQVWCASHLTHRCIHTCRPRLRAFSCFRFFPHNVNVRERSSARRHLRFRDLSRRFYKRHSLSHSNQFAL